MKHLSPAAFIDLLDGSLPESAVPHLSSCVGCQRQLAELRATWHTANVADVPEPSPLFWDHLSARVRDAVAAEPSPAPAWWRTGWRWRVAGLASVAGAAIAVFVSVQAPQVDDRAVRDGQFAATTIGATAAGMVPLPPLTDDDPLVFVADLASNIDWDGVPETDFAAYGVDRAVADMNEDERAELQRLLKQALGGGA